MTARKGMATVLTLAALSAFTFSSVPAAEINHGLQFSVLGGFQVLNSNDTTFPETMVNVPVVGAIGHNLSRIFAIEGEFGWMIPVSQEVEVGSGTGPSIGDRKTQTILTYQGNIVVKIPAASSRFSPYLVAGAGAMTFLSDEDSDRLFSLTDSQTAFAINFGIGTEFALGSAWALRADFREFVAFPSEADDPTVDKELAPFSTDGDPDTFFMERGTLGLTYHF